MLLCHWISWDRNTVANKVITMVYNYRNDSRELRKLSVKSVKKLTLVREEVEAKRGSVTILNSCLLRVCVFALVVSLASSIGQILRPVYVREM